MKYLFQILTLFTCFVLGSCLPPKSLFLGAPDHHDMSRFPHRTIVASEECFSFYRSTENFGQHLKINDWTTDIPFFVSLEEMMTTHKVRSFLVIKNDTILYEYAGQNTDPDDLHPSYSIAKSFMATLIGIAIDEGYIKNEKDLVSVYLPELKQHLQAENLSLQHLLNHTSGIKERLDLDATLYYGNDIYTCLKKIEFESTPGTKQHYINANVQLLGMVLHRATEMYPADYLTKKIWEPIQMCSDGIWSVDKDNEFEKTFCCIGATTLDYAKFGRLYLNKGQWNKQQIFSEDWYEKSIRRDTTEGSSFNYNHCWHIGLKEYNDYMAIGLYKQHIYINENKNLIIVLLNNKENKLAAERVVWWNVFRQIADQL